MIERRMHRLVGMLLCCVLISLGLGLWVSAADPVPAVYLAVVQSPGGAAPTPTPPPGEEVIIVKETFEGEFPGAWDLSGQFMPVGDYTWGKRDCEASEGSYSGWAVGGGTDGEALACGANYPNGVDIQMVYGPFSLEGATKAEMTFQYWSNTEDAGLVKMDYLSYAASINADSAEPRFHGRFESGVSGGWKTATLDLTKVPTLGDLTGEPKVWVKIGFKSDESVNLPVGVYVDNIVVKKLMSESAEP